jgi:hypothetical protein
MASSKNPISVHMVSSPPPKRPIIGIPVLAGLICRHANCGAVFSKLDDSDSHAKTTHAGTVLVETCAIQELESANGSEVVLVLDEPGQ